MSVLNPATVSLADEVDDEVSIPIIGASVVIGDDSEIASSSRELPEIAPELQANEEKGGSEGSFVFRSDESRATVSKISDECAAPKGQRTSSSSMVRRIPPEKVTEELYGNFIRAFVGRELLAVEEEQYQMLDAMVNGNEYSVACDVEDEVLGTLSYVIVHLPSKKFVLTAEQRQRAIEKAVLRFKDDKHPIVACLQLIQKNYIGFPAVIKLRNSLLECFNHLNSHESASASTTENAMKKTNTGFTVPSNDFFFRPVRGLQRMPSINASAPIPDNHYDTLVQILLGKLDVEEILDWMTKEIIMARLTGDVEVEFWDQAKEFLAGGWRIRHKDSGKIIPRKSEVDDIWRLCCETMGGSHSQKEMLAYLDDRYVGVSTKSRWRVANKDALLKGTRVQFPSKPRCVGVKPMHYVQVDMIEMEGTQYGDRLYNVALVVTDLYSQFVFGRALSEGPDISLIMRHLMDMFGSFGPPEAFRSYTQNPLIPDAMKDIGKLFKVKIKDIGQGAMSHYNLRASMYKHAEEELGSRERWVEALPFAIIEHNQRPLKGFGDVLISPFEIMFGRRAWKNFAIPPWVSDTYEREKEMDFERIRAVESISEDGQVELEYEPLPPSLKKLSRPDASATLASIYLNDMADNRSKISFLLGRYPPKFEEDGRAIDPGTGYMYEVGDHVYMRNTGHRDYCFNKAKRRSEYTRYFRATIADIDYYSSDFMYSVYFWDTVVDVDSLPDDDWPGEGCREEWVSPFDIAPSTPDLARRRNIARRREMEYQCRCGYDFCELVFSPNCPFRLSEACCLRLRMNCPFHLKKEAAGDSKDEGTKKNTVSNGKPRLVTKKRLIEGPSVHPDIVCIEPHVPRKGSHLRAYQAADVQYSPFADGATAEVAVSRVVERMNVPEESSSTIAHTLVRRDVERCSSDGSFAEEINVLEEDAADEGPSREIERKVSGAARTVPYQVHKKRKAVSSSRTEVTKRDRLLDVGSCLQGSKDSVVVMPCDSTSALPYDFERQRLGNFPEETDNKSPIVDSYRMRRERPEFSTNPASVVSVPIKINLTPSTVRKRVSAPPRRLSPS